MKSTKTIIEALEPLCRQQGIHPEDFIVTALRAAIENEELFAEIVSAAKDFGMDDATTTTAFKADLVETLDFYQSCGDDGSTQSESTFFGNNQ